MGTALRPTGRRRLAEQEAIIDRDIDRFHAVGLALATIRDEGLYAHDGFATFDAYIRSRARWRFGRSRAYQLITLAEVDEAVSTPGGHRPTEKQARELAKLPAESQPAAWEAATGGGQEPPSAARIAELVAKARASVPAGRLAEQPPEKQREAILEAERSLRERDAEEARQVGGEGRKERLAAVDRAIALAIKLADGLGEEADDGVGLLSQARRWFRDLPAA